MRGELLEVERVGSILTAFFVVYKHFGYGLSESIYSSALSIELEERGHDVVREKSVDVLYKGKLAARQRLDLVVDNRVIVETKAAEKLSSVASAQVLTYLRATQFEVGVLLHFGPSPKYFRFVDTPKRRRFLSPAVDTTLEHFRQDRETAP